MIAHPHQRGEKRVNPAVCAVWADTVGSTAAAAVPWFHRAPGKVWLQPRLKCSIQAHRTGSGHGFCPARSLSEREAHGEASGKRPHHLIAAADGFPARQTSSLVNALPKPGISGALLSPLSLRAQRKDLACRALPSADAGPIISRETKSSCLDKTHKNNLLNNFYNVKHHYTQPNLLNTCEA
ncbi:hypothetical protein [Acidihalobacter ferrooxydans]|uniref:hypothetical protein n=1 Tax=Acidihalobacter ferrooxydans TaxID=1765967 RepID=UPI0012ECACB9|nr:hypothetical protein [Acidihalobacter ferrooxydans]